MLRKSDRSSEVFNSSWEFRTQNRGHFSARGRRESPPSETDVQHIFWLQGVGSRAHASAEHRSFPIMLGYVRPAREQRVSPIAGPATPAGKQPAGRKILRWVPHPTYSLEHRTTSRCLRAILTIGAGSQAGKTRMEAGFSSRLSKRSPCISAPAGSSGQSPPARKKKMEIYTPLLSAIF